VFYYKKSYNKKDIIYFKFIFFAEILIARKWGFFFLLSMTRGIFFLENALLEP
jgi:hypothetical protein